MTSPSHAPNRFTVGQLFIGACIFAAGAALVHFATPREADLLQEKTFAPVEAAIIPATKPLSGGAPEKESDVTSKPDTMLISRILPDAEIRGVERLDFGLGTYIWEIEMLADRTNPETGGFVYLSADGTKLLNGPLMDKRSRVLTTTRKSPPPSAPDQAAASPTQSLTDGEIPTPEQGFKEKVEKATRDRNMFFSGITKLQYFSTTEGKNPVYVMFDPLCSECAKLYQQHKSIAAAYDVEFRWVPVFLNEKSYPVTAVLQKTLNEDRDKGYLMMDQMLTKQWKPDQHHDEIAKLTEADYGVVKPATGVFYEMGKVLPGIGTPYVTFKNPTGDVLAFAGVPLASDWLNLKATK